MTETLLRQILNELKKIRRELENIESNTSSL